MSRSKHLLPRVAALAALAVAVGFACGPFFGIEVLPNRRQVLLAPPAVSFELALQNLAPPPTDKLPVVELDIRDKDEPKAASATGLMQLYASGAASFHSGAKAAARASFQKVLSLAGQQQDIQVLKAHYMLGRLAVEMNEQPEAVTHFEAVRSLVRQGALDTLGLAVASFGEQARGAWRHGAVATAVELYARQASYGSQGGANSLVMIAGLIAADTGLLNQAIQDATVRRLLFICLNGNSGSPFFIEPQANTLASPYVDRVVAALEVHHLTQVEGAGLLAAAAYRQGRFDLALKLSNMEEAPISAWVQAKLAMRQGDWQTALKDYDKALKTAQPSMGDPAATIRAELAALRVSRGDYIQALDLFYRAAAKSIPTESTDRQDSDGEWRVVEDYWGDVAYLAERVLTIGELRNYLDHTLPALPTPERLHLRSILARRLMRAGRRREAAVYFDDKKLRGDVEQYDRLLNTANSWWRFPLTRAKSWFAAATLARYCGMELLGFEKEPDFASSNGTLGFDAGEMQATEPRLPGVEDPYESADERKRVADSAPTNDVRFQYRMTAVDHAMRSADFLPARSQAFAAVLCEASRWVSDRQPERARQIYQRYLHQGAHVAWGRRFGRTCPQPNFSEASIASAASRKVGRFALHARTHPVYASLGTILTIAILALMFVYTRASAKSSR